MGGWVGAGGGGEYGTGAGSVDILMSCARRKFRSDLSEFYAFATSTLLKCVEWTRRRAASAIAAIQTETRLTITIFSCQTNKKMPIS